MVLTPLLFTTSSLQLGSRSSVQCLAVGVCLCFHQPLDEGSKMAYKGTMYVSLSVQNLDATQMSSTEEWTEKIWYIYTIENYSVGKKINGIFKFKGKWMELEETILSELF
ncbi:protein of unknown function DUF1725 containing protein [Cricetulus griseus]|nr:protein of unknown function DUF1725 containing protein [Cricetulus griseus]